MERRKVLGVVGSLILMGGVFTPIMSAPFIGSLNYFRNGQGDGVIVLALGAISLALVFAGRLRSLLVTGVLSLAMLAFTFINVQLRLAEMRSNLDEQLAGNPFGGLARGMVESVQLQWGWALLVAGAGVVIAAAVVRSSHVKCVHCAEAIQPDARICKHCRRDVLTIPDGTGDFNGGLTALHPSSATGSRAPGTTTSHLPTLPPDSGSEDFAAQLRRSMVGTAPASVCVVPSWSRR